MHIIYIYNYIYNIYIFVLFAQVCVAYIVKKAASFWVARSINGRDTKEHMLKLPTSRKNVKLQLILINVLYSSETV